MKNYVASGLVVFNLQTKQIVFNVTLGISQVLEADNLTYEKGRVKKFGQWPED